MPPLGVISSAGDIGGATYGVLTNRVVIEMDNTIHLLEQDVSPLATMLLHPALKTVNAASPKVEWLEDQILPRIASASGSFTFNATSIVVAAGYGVYFKPNDLVRDENTGEVFLVTAVVTDTLTVQRGIGNSGTGIASGGAADTLVRLSNASVEGQTLPQIRMTQPIANFNYTQIFRYPYGFTGTAEATNTYGGDLRSFERQKKAIEIKRDLEQTLWAGKRDISTPAAQHGQRFAGGALSYINTNVTTLGANLTTTNLEIFLRSVVRYNTGMPNMVIFASPVAAAAIGNFAMSKLAPPSADVKKWGVNITSYQSSSGLQMPIVVKQDWNDLSTTSPSLGGYLVVLNMDNVRLRQLNGRSLRIMENRQANDEDAVKDEWMAELTLQFIQEQTHGILRGITG